MRALLSRHPSSMPPAVIRQRRSQVLDLLYGWMLSLLFNTRSSVGLRHQSMPSLVVVGIATLLPWVYQ